MRMLRSVSAGLRGFPPQEMLFRISGLNQTIRRRPAPGSAKLRIPLAESIISAAAGYRDDKNEVAKASGSFRASNQSLSAEMAACGGALPQVSISLSLKTAAPSALTNS